MSTEWNIAHVLNCLSQGIPIPPDRYTQTKALIEAYVSDAINMHRLDDTVRAAEKMHTECHDALSRGDMLRARTLIVDWALEYNRDVPAIVEMSSREAKR